MFFYRMLTAFTIIYLLLQNINVAQTQASHRRCQKDSLVWSCPVGKGCGSTYESCINGYDAMDTNGMIILIVFGVVMTLLFALSIYYYCVFRRKMTVGRFARNMQTTVDAQRQQQSVYYIDSNTPVNAGFPILEAHPPAYEQSQNTGSRDQ